MGIIYEIICWTTGLRYIGQTTRSFQERLYFHKYNLDCSSKYVLEHGNYEIYELEKVDDELLLRDREKYYIQHSDCVNQRIGTFDPKEYKKIYHQTEKYKESKKQADKRYREKKKLEKSLLK